MAALSMGPAALEYCNYEDYGSDLDDEYAFTPRAFERTTAPRSSKRTYGLFLESDPDPERKLRPKIDEQLELLRAVLPNSCTEEKASILTGAYEYIEKLQRQVQELQYELDSEHDSSVVDFWEDEEFCEQSRHVDYSNAAESSCSSCGVCSQPTVEVVRIEEGLKIHIECCKVPGLLVEIMELLESCGLNVEQASIACQDHLVFDGIGCEVEVSDGCRVSAEAVQTGLQLLIEERRQIGGH